MNTSWIWQQHLVYDRFFTKYIFCKKAVLLQIYISVKKQPSYGTVFLHNIYIYIYIYILYIIYHQKRNERKNWRSKECCTRSHVKETIHLYDIHFHVVWQYIRAPIEKGHDCHMVGTYILMKLSFLQGIWGAYHLTENFGNSG